MTHYQVKVKPMSFKIFLLNIFVQKLTFYPSYNK